MNMNGKKKGVGGRDGDEGSCGYFLGTTTILTEKLIP